MINLKLIYYSLGSSVAQSTIEDYGSHTVSVTHLNGFGKCEQKIELGSNSDIENDSETNQQTKHKKEENPNNAGLRKDDLKNVNKLVAKTVSKSKAFSHLKRQDKKSTGGKKVNKLQKKFSKKSMESKRAKHYNPKNKSHKKNKKV